MPQMPVVIDIVEQVLARKDFKQCHFSQENLPYASPRGFSGQLSDMLYAEITWIQRALAFHLPWHIICTIEVVTMVFGLWSQLLLQEQDLLPQLSPRTNRTPAVCVCINICMSLTELGMWEDLWQRGISFWGQGSSLNIRLLSLARHQVPSVPELVGCLVTEMMIWTKFKCVMGV